MPPLSDKPFPKHLTRKSTINSENVKIAIKETLKMCGSVKKIVRG